MRSLVGGILAVSLVATAADGSDRRDELFASWEQAQQSLRSLAVEFTLETNDPVFKEQDKFDGVFRLIRTPKGEVFASYDELQKKSKSHGDRFSGLLNDNCLYVLHHDTKTAERLVKAPAAEIQRLLEERFNPFVVLLNRKHAEEKCKLEVIEQDESFTYLAVTPKQVKRQGWFPDIMERGGVVLINKDSETVPKDMPTRLFYVGPVGVENNYNIKSWKLNAADAPKLDEFAKPEDRPGWKVYGAPVAEPK
jgi:hypothetical protein